jgi:hypothetical protein
MTEDVSAHRYTSRAWRDAPRRCIRTARVSRQIVVIGALLASTSPLHAQESRLPERRFTAQPIARWAEPMSEVAGVRELSDGRVIVLDSREQRLVLVDLATGAAQAIGRRGQGPGEYSRAVRLVPVPGDSTFVVDGENRRILVIGGDGVPNGLLTSFGVPADAQGLGIWALRDADVVYGAYFQGRGPPPKDGDLIAPDSLPIFRLDLVSGRIDSMASFAVPHSKITIARDGQKITAINIERPPFSVGDEWAVGDDGRVAIARRSPYRVDLVSRDLRVMRGVPVPAEERRVEATDRAEYLAQRADGASRDPATLEWPERMPLFLPGAVIAVPNGETWVRRTPRAGAPTVRHDVFDARGQRVAELVTAASQRVVLVTARGVYVARTDDDGLQYLERFAQPR